VTFDATADSATAHDDARPALIAALAITAVAVATLAGAWFFQLVLDVRPCPLCLEQRLCLLSDDPARGVDRAGRGQGCAVRRAARWARDSRAGRTRQCRARHLSRRCRVGFFGKVRPTAAVRSATSAAAGSLLQRLDTVKVIRCDEVQWRFLGLSLAGYNVLISLAMAAIAAWGLVKTTKHA